MAEDAACWMAETPPVMMWHGGMVLQTKTSEKNMTYAKHVMLGLIENSKSKAGAVLKTKMGDKYGSCFAFG